MKKITGEELKKLIRKQETEFNDLEIDIGTSLDIDLRHNTSDITFDKCILKGERIGFSISFFSSNETFPPKINFKECTIHNDLMFDCPEIMELTLINCHLELPNLQIITPKIGRILIQNNHKIKTNKLNIYIQIGSDIRSLKILNLKSTGDLIIDKNTIHHIEIKNSSFNNVKILKNKIENSFLFTDNTIRHESNFISNRFKFSDFTSSDLGKNSLNTLNDYEDITLFEEVENKKTSNIKFSLCDFHKTVYFNNSQLNNLTIETTKFLESASFQEIKLNTISLERVIFEKNGFFDDIQITNPKDCNKRTFRVIKQQLLKTENKIDYDNFRAFELNSHKEDLKAKLKTNPINRKKIKRDLTILRLTSFFSNNGTDWGKAIMRTISVALIFYSIFFMIHNFNKDIDFSMSSINTYLVGLFRYFLITDLHNPLLLKKEYLSSAIEWLPFVLGKILIGIGIYETVISFRKFKK